MPELLFLTCHLPYPLISGGRRREYELIRRLSDSFSIHLVAFTKTYGEDLENSIVFDDMCASVTVVPVEEAPGHTQPLQVRRHACSHGTALIEGLIEQKDIDLVHVEGFYLMQHIPQKLRRPLFLQEQNVEYLLWKQRAGSAVDPREKARSTWEYLTTVQFEQQAWRRADLCGAVTTEDRDVMARVLGKSEVRVVPDGFDHLTGELGASSRDGLEPTAVFVANFAYQPNEDAAFYLCDKIWPLVRKRVPRARLRLVGNSPAPEVEALAFRPDMNVEVTGRVPDVDPYLDEAHVVVCPLRVGGGIKVKVLEALYRGKAVVTTSIGAQGIPDPTNAMTVCDNPLDFGRATARLLTTPQLRRILEARAAMATRGLPTWDDAAHALGRSYEQLLSRSEAHEETPVAFRRAGRA